MRPLRDRTWRDILMSLGTCPWKGLKLLLWNPDLFYPEKGYHKKKASLSPDHAFSGFLSCYVFSLYATWFPALVSSDAMNTAKEGPCQSPTAVNIMAFITPECPLHNLLSNKVLSHRHFAITTVGGLDQGVSLLVAEIEARWTLK